MRLVHFYTKMQRCMCMHYLIRLSPASRFVRSLSLSLSLGSGAVESCGHRLQATLIRSPATLSEISPLPCRKSSPTRNLTRFPRGPREVYGTGGRSFRRRRLPTAWCGSGRQSWEAAAVRVNGSGAEREGKRKREHTNLEARTNR